MIAIPLTKGYVTTVDPEDADLLEFRWCALVAGKHVYAIRKNPTNRKNISVHRTILARMLGRPLSDTEYVDHINLDGLDNRRSNLRLATKAQNQRNRRTPKNNTSGYKGVRRTLNGRWQATICANRKTIYLGVRDTAPEAYALYCEAAKRYFGEFAQLDGPTPYALERIRVFKLTDSNHPNYSAYAKTRQELDQLLDQMLGDTGEHEDFPDSYHLSVSFEFMTKEQFDSLEEWAA